MENGSTELESVRSYKYVGAEESHNIVYIIEKEKLEEYIRRLKLILTNG
jgi:hypothetical protein